MPGYPTRGFNLWDVAAIVPKPASGLPAPWVLGGVLPSYVSAGGILITVGKAISGFAVVLVAQFPPARA